MVAKFKVVLQPQGTIAFSDLSESDARRRAEVLNDGMQEKAKNMGFHYDVLPQRSEQHTVKELIVVCAANLTGSSQCPKYCGKCWYGGEIPILWSFQDQGYVQYYPNRDAIDQEFEAVKNEWLDHGGDHLRAKMEALKDWLDKNPVRKDIVCNFCGGKLGKVQKQKHDNPNFAEYRTCLKCSYQWAKEYWAWLAKVQGVEA